MATPMNSVADVVGAFEAIDRGLPDGDGLKWFNWLYLTVTKAVQRVVFFPTWRLSYWEDTLLKRNPWATGLHLTAIKHG